MPVAEAAAACASVAEAATARAAHLADLVAANIMRFIAPADIIEVASPLPAAIVTPRVVRVRRVRMPLSHWMRQRRRAERVVRRARRLRHGIWIPSVPRRLTRSSWPVLLV